jgi:hypothetical protein
VGNPRPQRHRDRVAPQVQASERGGVMNNSDIRRRVQLFSALRAGQRALARCIHPSQVAPLRQRGREVLIRLQALGAVARDGGRAEKDDEQLAALEETLHEVDGLISVQTSETLEIIQRLEFNQLRATGRRLSLSHPEEVAALIDVMLQGDIEDNKLLRLIEYLVTMTCSEEWNGRLTVVGEASDATPGLRQLARELLAGEGILSSAAVKVLGDAEASLIHGDDLRGTRDAMREYKEGLGRHFLHPHILDAVVSYNTAMWNQVAAQVETSLGIDQLADDLLSDLSLEDKAANESLANAANQATGFRASPGFRRLVDAFGARLAKREIADSEAGRVVSRFELDGIRPSEIEAFEAQNSTTAQELIRDAVVLARLIRTGSVIDDLLHPLELDAALLEGQGIEELTSDMNREARELFARSRYNDAFALSEVKTRNLVSLARVRRARGEDESNPASAAARWRFWPFRADAKLPLQVLGVALGFGLLALLLSFVEGGGVSTLSPSQLSQISPFLESGRENTHEGARRFVGEHSPAWNYLGTAERREVAQAIAQHFEEADVDTTILLGPGPRVMASVENGKVVSLVAKSGDDAARDRSSTR